MIVQTLETVTTNIILFLLPPPPLNPPPPPPPDLTQDGPQMYADGAQSGWLKMELPCYKRGSIVHLISVGRGYE